MGCDSACNLANAPEAAAVPKPSGVSRRWSRSPSSGLWFVLCSQSDKSGQVSGSQRISFFAVAVWVGGVHSR